MKKKKKSASAVRADAPRPPDPNASWLPAALFGFVAVAALLGFLFFSRETSPLVSGTAPAPYQPKPPGTLTFTKDIAPIIFENCSSCHRPGQAGPFNLLTYQDVEKRARQIVEVTQSGFMPPWLPEPGLVRFMDERLLTAEQRGILRQWFEEGAPEGLASDLPPIPEWQEGWQLGRPDLVIQPSEPYVLAAEGRDVYRNLVIPIPLSERRYVAAVEFHPGNWKVVHHAAMRLDRTRESRRRDEAEPGPGFSGMTMPASTEMPDGQFLNWQPGKQPYRVPDGLSWTLQPGTDFVLQLHLQPSGKEEAVLPSIGFYFTDKPPLQKPFKIILDAPIIDIPAGATQHVVEDRFVLPVDVNATAVFPHAHYLGKDIQAFALLPDGRQQWLLRIREWDFNWQGDYRFAQPVFLPRGSTLVMRFSYDNSAANPRNPHHPPQRVVFGPQSTDEMGELWLQVTPLRHEDHALLERAHTQHDVSKTLVRYQHRLTLDPNDAQAHLQLGKAFMLQGRAAEATSHLGDAARLDPRNDEPLYHQGVLLRSQNRLADAKSRFLAALKLNPENHQAHGNLGLIFAQEGRLPQAEQHFREALRINPEDQIAKEMLAELRAAMGAASSPR